jgi:hypothetical protein
MNLVLESESENAILDFRLLPETEMLEVILQSAGHWIIWSAPTCDARSDPLVAYDGFVRQAGEMAEDLIARVRFFIDEWKNFIDFMLEN